MFMNLKKQWLTLLAWLLMLSPAFAMANGEKAPVIHLKNASEQQFSSSDLAGRPYLIKLGTTWCPGCRQQNRELEHLKSFLESRGIRVVDVFLQDSWEDIRQFYSSQNLPVPELALLDDGSVRKDFQVFAIPRLLLVGQDGKVRWDLGFLPAEEVQHQIEQVID